jgi:hypothetical protein
MAFKLRVEFTGPNLFVLHTANGDTKEVTVLMPDGRRFTHPTPKHLDGTPAEHHVGFVRVDLADMSLPYPKGKEGKPSYELVHRFVRQELTFGDGLAPEPMTNLNELDLDIVAPKAKRFALEPLDGVLENDVPPGPVLMRTTLRGGTFLPNRKTQWELPPHMNPGGGPYKERFVSTVTWQRDIAGDRLPISVTGFGQTTPEAVFQLGPFQENEIVTLAVGNLCAHNPLDWADLLPPEVPKEDEDFKWVYYLLRTRGKPTLDIPAEGLPTPVLAEVIENETGDEACMGAKMTLTTT